MIRGENEISRSTDINSVVSSTLAYAQEASNFTSYTCDLTNTTAIIVWSGKYCNWDSNTHPPTHIAKDGDPKHTAECNKTYDIANNILSNEINKEGRK